MSYSSNLNDEDIFNSQSSDEKMDTGSESFTTQDTPNSVLSSDFDDRDDQNVLRLQNPETINVLRLAEPENDNARTKFKEHNDSLVTKMSNLTINSPITDSARPRNLGISPPKLSSTLISTTNHPLMGLGSPDGNYPDLIPKKVKLEEEKDLSLSSIEDERTNETNFDLYSPLCNTSKNNLYFTENFVTADSQILNESHRESLVPPDVARIDKKIRRKIIPRISESPPTKTLTTPHRILGRIIDGNRDENAITKYIEERNKRVGMHSTPRNGTESDDISGEEEYHTGVSEWCESPILRPVANFQLPIEMSTNVNIPHELESPDVISSSTHSEASLQAHLSIHAGRACLKHTNKRTEFNNSEAERRKIAVLPLEDDSCSVESVSGASMGSEEDEPAPPPAALHAGDHSDDDCKRSKSSLSSYSSGIPEYSAADELRDERRWLTVTRAGVKTTCDMTVIEPYKRFVSHGGYDKSGVALIVFSACHLPDNSRMDYTYVMDNLFLYVIWSLERLITDEYILVYLHGSAARRRLPSFHWLHECYKLIDRRLRKSLKHLYLVHPTFWLKSFVILTKPFVSSKFFRKLSYVKSLEQLFELVPVEPNAIPDLVKDYDAGRR